MRKKLSVRGKSAKLEQPALFIEFVFSSLNALKIQGKMCC